MITKDEALRIVDDHLNKGRQGPRTGDLRRVIDDGRTVEREYGWLFSYNSALYLRTGDRRDGLVGNGPVLVRREDGAVIRFSSAWGNEEALEAYEADPGKFRVTGEGS